jgi:hypothetical protein
MTTEPDASDTTPPALDAVTRRGERSPLQVHKTTAKEVRRVRDALNEANADKDISTDDVIRLNMMLSGLLSSNGELEDTSLPDEQMDVLGAFADAVGRVANPKALGAVDRAKAPVDDDPGGDE